MQLCDPMDYSLPGSFVQWDFPGKNIEWVAVSSSKGLPDPGMTCISCGSCVGRFFTAELPGKHASHPQPTERLNVYYVY